MHNCYGVFFCIHLFQHTRHNKLYCVCVYRNVCQNWQVYSCRFNPEICFVFFCSNKPMHRYLVAKADISQFMFRNKRCSNSVCGHVGWDQAFCILIYCILIMIELCGNVSRFILISIHFTHSLWWCIATLIAAYVRNINDRKIVIRMFRKCKEN